MDVSNNAFTREWGFTRHNIFEGNLRIAAIPERSFNFSPETCDLENI